ncbi:DNA helicase UvrD [Brasilonema octagenarum UFV-E1]|uniref:DNA 3'-5' helicase n=1 Tax=Brasilonema sennae CENA114 TaxID=415709 RepID=A0A856M8G3_9CYAN|nr:ATP-dependent helicase [Brasilonema sennae]QDL07012.1 DNA helicase UvrD [Brasilonema sennae CENA114]QDL13374.1 DNA helicase UvrD [Brasilonema octagenarum UFV-E1]
MPKESQSIESTLPVPSPQETGIANIRNTLRQGQQRMADWNSGSLAVSAVPGAGKSTGMAAAAAIAIAHQYEQSAQSRRNIRRQLIVVTFTRSAAANIKIKIREYLKELSLPQTGFSVNTLHGLALNIASRYPNLSGLELDNVTLITPNQSHRFIRTAVEQWIATAPGRYSRLLEGIQFDGEETERLRRQSVLRTEVLPELATIVIHEAKSSGLLPEDLREFGKKTTGKQGTDEYNILSIAAGLYEQYQNLMRSRDFIDYDDMILAALRVLENDNARKIEQNKVFAVFEDEAQDSSPLQTKLLTILAKDADNLDEPPNMIRVGDPNQAINSSFTPADPIYFRQFCKDCDAQQRLVTMDQAGRSTKIIIDAANFVLEWVNSLYVKTTQQEDNNRETQINKEFSQTPPTPFRFQRIRPVEPNHREADVNPQAVGLGLELYTPRDIHHTVELLSQRIVELFSQEPDNISAAILVREHRQGRWLAQALSSVCKEHNIPVYDVGERDRHSHVPEEVLALLQFCDRPHSPDYLKRTLEVLLQRRLIETQDFNALATLPEEFLYPTPLASPQPQPVQKAAHLCRSLLRARLELPLYQLISFIALTLKYEQAELATADKLAERVIQQIAGNTSMGSMLNVLSEIVSSERFEPVETEDLEKRYTRNGQLTIITMHKAKGLDWDYVFMPFLHENLIPGRFWVPPQSQFLGNFTLSEVARAQIRAALHGQSTLPSITTAWEQAKHLKTAEEYRLLYVAMTRAKRLLWMSAAKKAPFTWSKPENLQEQTPCPVFPALKRQFPKSVRN